MDIEQLFMLHTVMSRSSQMISHINHHAVCIESDLHPISFIHFIKLDRAIYL